MARSLDEFPFEHFECYRELRRIGGFLFQESIDGAIQQR